MYLFNSKKISNFVVENEPFIFSCVCTNESNYETIEQGR